MERKRYILNRIAALTLVLLLRASAQERYLVRIHDDAVANFAQNHGLTLLTTADKPDSASPGSIGPLQHAVAGLYVVTLPSEAPAAAVQSLQNDPTVLRLEVNQRIGLPKRHSSSAHLHTEDEGPTGATSYFGTAVWKAYVNQPAAGIVGIADAHQIATGAGVVAFLDTGVDFTNPILSASLNFGWDFTTNSPGGFELSSAQLNQSTTSILDSESVVLLNQSTTSILDQSTTSILDGQPVTDAFGHGTMIAGIIHLVAPTARLLPVKVFGNDGTSDLATILSGFYWAIDHGAKVINMSFSMSDPSPEFEAALEYANGQHVISVASAGNDGEQVTVYPAGYSQVMGIASSSSTDTRSAFSNYGDAVTVAAPGEGIISTYPNSRYAAGWGTSFSAPFVSGAAALLVDIKSNINENRAQKAISQAVPIDQGLGAGRLDLFQACSYETSRGNN